MNNISPSAHLIRIYAILFFLSAVISGFVCLSSAMAEEEASKFIEIIPTITTANNQNAPLPAKTTHDALRLTPDKSEIIQLSANAASIIVGNPAHLSILADTPSTLVLVPKRIGATHFSALDYQGNLIMQRHVIVAAPGKDYIHIKKTCSGKDKNCVTNSVYYCPDTCHEIAPQEDRTNKTKSIEKTK